MRSKKPVVAPVWWKNSYFVISAILVLVTVLGLPFLGGDHAIRDPGQKREDNIWIVYLVSLIVMLINGWLSHQQALRTFQALPEQNK